MIPKPFQPDFYPPADCVDPNALYVGLPVYGWVTLDRATSDTKYQSHLGDKITEVLKGSQLLDRIKSRDHKGELREALQVIEHDFADAEVVGVLVNTVCQPRRVEVTVVDADGTRVTYRQNMEDEAAESWSKVCEYTPNGDRVAH